VFDTMITVVGNVVDSPRKVRAGKSEVAKFRIASTPRRFDSSAQRFVDGETFYVDVECWDDLGTHVLASVGGGDPVVVLGAISTSEWETDGGRRSKDRIRARVVGHNLSWGISRFTKLPRPAALLAEPPVELDAELRADTSDEELGDAVDELTGEILRVSLDPPLELAHALVGVLSEVTHEDDPATEIVRVPGNGATRRAGRVVPFSKGPGRGF